VGRAKLAQKFARTSARTCGDDQGSPDQQVAEIGYVIGDVRGKNAIIVDDIIDTAGTLAPLRRRFASRASSVSLPRRRTAFLWAAFENIERANLEQVVVTDTIPLAPGAPAKMLQLPCADMLTDSIRRIFTDGSVSEVFAGENQLF